MTETGTLIQAQAEAVNALTTALTNAIDGNQVQNLGDVRGFLAAWTAGVNAMLPNIAPSDASTAGRYVDSEPTVIGTTVRDSDGDHWTRAHDGTWVSRRSPEKD